MEKEIATIENIDRKEPIVNFEQNISLEVEEEQQKAEESVGLEEENQASEEENQSTAGNEEQEENEDVQKNHILGKFESVEMLENAYKSLQSEFTRKSQELANLKRTFIVDNPQTSLDNIVEFAKEINNESIVEELSKQYLHNESLLTDKFGLTKAVFQMLSDKIDANVRNLQSDEWLYNFVSTNSLVKEKIINDYIENCAKGRVPPLISKTVGANLVASTPSAPKTLEDVASVITNWLNKKWSVQKTSSN